MLNRSACARERAATDAYIELAALTALAALLQASFAAEGAALRAAVVGPSQDGVRGQLGAVVADDGLGCE
jgi:hypothetical protein